MKGRENEPLLHVRSTQHCPLDAIRRATRSWAPLKLSGCPRKKAMMEKMSE